MKYRPNECMSCGGKKMQIGGIQLDLSALNNINEPLVQGYNVPYIQEEPKKPLNRIQEMIQKGLLETPRGYDSAMEAYIAKTGDGDPQGKKRKKVDPFELYLKMQALQAGLSGIGNIMERGRQNQYMYDQFSSLGQVDPLPVSNAQPNPYNLYAKYGGNLKKYMQSGGLTAGLIPKPTYDFDLYTYARNARGVDPFGIPSSQDTANYKRNMMLLFSGDKRAIDRDKKGITELGKDLNMFDMFTYGRLEDEMSAYRDAKNVMTPEQIQVELNQPLVMPPDVTRKKQYGGYGRMKMKNVNIYNGILPTPDPMAEIAQQFEESQLLNIYGGNRRRMLRDLRRGNSPIPVEMLSGENMGQQGYLQDGNFVLNQLFKSGGWIKKATDSIKRRGTEGKCTPITKPGCTGRAKALALTFKKIARNRKKD